MHHRPAFPVDEKLERITEIFNIGLFNIGIFKNENSFC